MAADGSKKTCSDTISASDSLVKLLHDRSEYLYISSSISPSAQKIGILVVGIEKDIGLLVFVFAVSYFSKYLYLPVLVRLLLALFISFPGNDKKADCHLVE
ncbi:hypothetical protein RHGRI_005964 [Rhododendron griersonianum]|uniref:Uncharacterized protein n=1 Tax=Rhododendron griersonianum TaxID=479676 RepID=A0AAV6LF84_9ERIC|nr:hypothetical protein RHGRI_005964 [Rhododendron griersonianum]